MALSEIHPRPFQTSRPAILVNGRDMGGAMPKSGAVNLQSLEICQRQLLARGGFNLFRFRDHGVSLQQSCSSEGGRKIVEDAFVAESALDLTAPKRPQGAKAKRALARVASAGVFLFAHVVTAVRGNWKGVAPIDEQRIYFANHASHGDFVLIWAALPPLMRQRTRPVAGADYWLKSAVRRFIGYDVFNAVLIARDRLTQSENPITQMVQALDDGSSLILFPEGTRNLSDAPLLPFKGGLYHLARTRPNVSLVPTWIDNLNRVLPKGEVIPIPLICTVTFGPPLRIGEGETKKAFLDRAEAALLALPAKAPLT